MPLTDEERAALETAAAEAEKRCLFNPGLHQRHGGEITLRDLFAAAALMNLPPAASMDLIQHAPGFAEERAQAAYRQADAMLKARAIVTTLALALMLVFAVGCSEPEKDHPAPPSWSSDEHGIMCEGEGVRVFATSTTDHISITCGWPCGARVDFYAQPHVQFFPLFEEGCP